MTRFWSAFVLSAAATLALLAVAGWSISQILTRPPLEKLRTAAFEMELAKGWSCDLQGTEWVCDPPGAAPRNAIAIMAMKRRGKEDTLDAYEAHLRQPQSTGATGKDGARSTVEHVGRRRIGGHEWVEALQFSSEVPDYHTYYAATVTSHLGVLVTLSAHDSVFEQRRRELEQMLGSLVIYQRDSLAGAAAGQ